MNMHRKTTPEEPNRIFRGKTESIILFASTANFKDIYRYLVERKNICRVAVPENRLETPKIQAIQDFCSHS